MAKKQTKQKVTIATDKEVLEGEIMEFTITSEPGIMHVLIRVPGKYEDFKMGQKVEIKK